VEVISKVLAKSKNHPTLVFSVIGFCKMSTEEWFKDMKFLRCLWYTVLVLIFFPFCKYKFGLNLDLILPFILKPKSRMLSTRSICPMCLVSLALQWLYKPEPLS
jgi:hypothetical protein